MLQDAISDSIKRVSYRVSGNISSHLEQINSYNCRYDSNEYLK